MSFLCMVRGVLDKLLVISRSRELETRMASLGIREANAIFEEWKSLHQIEVKKSVHRISPHCAHLPLFSFTTAMSSSHSLRKQFLCSRSWISFTTRVSLLIFTAIA